jgi:uncharacterized membrane protein (UPF0127 family)
MRRVLAGSLISAALAGACAADDDARPVPTTVRVDAGATTGSDPDAPEDGVEPQGFTTVTVRITDADGDVCDTCVWLADSPEERARGLMGVTDLGEPVGMVFRFDELRAGGFWMFRTPTPLSIAWFGAGGELVGTADMEPCVDVPENGCPSYAPGDAYDLALEVFQGDLEALGVGPGSRLEIVEGTESPTCLDG